MVGQLSGWTQPAAFAGFWIRTAAYLVDAFLLSLFGGAFPYLFVQSSSAGQRSGTVGGASLLLSLVYFVLFWSQIGGGRTLGMRLLGLRVVRDDGTTLSLLEALIRWVFLWFSFGLCFLGVIWVAVDEHKQGWHDKIAKTFVVRT